MSTEKAMTIFDTEALYKIVTDLEGPRYPLDNMYELNKAYDYIMDYLVTLGIEVESQEFHVDGMDEAFYNVIAYIGDKDKPATLIGAHYDTGRYAPGANDNLSGVAVCLEVAKALSEMENPPSVIIALFSLEEGHPGVAKEIEKRLCAAGYIDEQNRQTSSRLQRFDKRFLVERRKRTRKGIEFVTAIEMFQKEVEQKLYPDEAEYLDIMVKTFREFRDRSDCGKVHYPIGSHEFVKKAISEGINIKDVIVYDCLGWIKDKPNTQSPLPVDDRINNFTKTYKVDVESCIGNYIGIVGEKSSLKILNKFTKKCECEDNGIPYLSLALPLDYEMINKMAPDVLRSDHGAFWEAGIPGIFVTDMANFRSELYHTPADTSYAMDFENLRKVAKVTYQTLVD